MPARAPHSRRLWFSLVWLWYLLFPVLKLYGSAQPLWISLSAGALLGLFCLMFAKVFMLLDRRPVRATWNWAAVLYCWALSSLSLPLLGGTAVTFLIYGAAMAAFQRSRAVSTLLVSLNLAGMGLL